MTPDSIDSGLAFALTAPERKLGVNMIVDLFKKSFWLGRLIWITGKNSLLLNQKLVTWLSECGVLSCEVLQLEAHQFVDLASKGVSRELIERYEVVVVHGFENLLGTQADRFIKATQTFCDFQSGLSLQLILVSNAKLSSDLKGIYRFKPTEISIHDDGDDPGDLNERIHDLLAIATKITNKSVVKLTERAAIFLESFIQDEEDCDILVLLARGLERSDGRELRLSDLVPQGGTRFASEALISDYY